MPRALLALPLLAATMAFASELRAEEAELEAALEAYRAGELDGAFRLLDEALRVSGNGPAELLEIHRHLGIIRATLGDIDGARRAFEAALALDPALPPPDELGPSRRTPFDDALEGREGRALAVEVTPPADLEASRDATLEVAARDAPAGLVARILLRAAAPDEAPHFTAEVSGVGPAAVRLPASAWEPGPVLELDVRAVDRYGGVLATERLELRLPQPEEDLLPAPTPPTPWYRNAWVWVSVALVAAAGGATLGAVLGTAEHRYLVGEPTLR